MEYGGFFGKMLRINLTDRTSQVEKLDQEVLKKFVGGSALGARYYDGCLREWIP